VITACAANQESRKGTQFNPFSLHWIGAMAQRRPDGTSLGYDPDADGDDRITLREAYQYACDRMSAMSDQPQFYFSSEKAATSVLGEPDLLFADELPVLEPLIREKWRRFNPEFDLVLRQNLAKLKKIEKELKKDLAQREKKALNEVSALLK
jgi:hypothetical protein